MKSADAKDNDCADGDGVETSLVVTDRLSEEQKRGSDSPVGPHADP